MKHLSLRVLGLGFLLSLGLAACQSATTPVSLDEPAPQDTTSRGVTMGSGA